MRRFNAEEIEYYAAKGALEGNVVDYFYFIWRLLL